MLPWVKSFFSFVKVNSPFTHNLIKFLHGPDGTQNVLIWNTVYITGQDSKVLLIVLFGKGFSGFCDSKISNPAVLCRCKLFHICLLYTSIKYEDMVQYPFGYGLSYTTFDKQIENFKDNGDTVTFDVTVENTGSVAGKDVVEIYYTAPYTNGGIEKAAANLIAFEKTDSIEPGESQTKSFTINKEDMASYDSEGIKTVSYTHLERVRILKYSLKD